MDAWTHKPPIGNQVASWWPNSREDLVAVLVSPPCGLILSVPAPDADWAPFGGGTKSPPPSLSPSVSLCLQHHAPKHSTGKWWEEKLKFANCWEMQREEGVSVSRKSDRSRFLGFTTESTPTLNKCASTQTSLWINSAWCYLITTKLLGFNQKQGKQVFVQESVWGYYTCFEVDRQQERSSKYLCPGWKKVSDI